MANYSIIQQGDTVQNGILSVACDFRDDVQDLPTDWVPGSTCLVIEDSSVHMLGLDREWHEI